MTGERGRDFPRSTTLNGPAMKATTKTITEPRLLGVTAAARYVGLSVWTLRRLAWNGAIPVVKLPALDGPEGKPMRRILFDRSDLDALINRSKETAGPR